MKQVISFDGGLANLGYCVVSHDGERKAVRQAGVIQTVEHDSSWGWRMCDDLTRRTMQVARELREILTKWSPVAAFAEALPIFKAVRPQVYISLCWGALCAELDRYRIPLATVAPNTWRKAVCGTKDEVTAHVVCMRQNKSFQQWDDRIPRLETKLHARDALGVFTWAEISGLVRDAVCR